MGEGMNRVWRLGISVRIARLPRFCHKIFSIWQILLWKKRKCGRKKLRGNALRHNWSLMIIIYKQLLKWRIPKKNGQFRKNFHLLPPAPSVTSPSFSCHWTGRWISSLVPTGHAAGAYWWSPAKERRVIVQCWWVERSMSATLIQTSCTRICLNVCAFPCYSMVDWLIE